MKKIIVLMLVAACGGVEPTIKEVDHGPIGDPKDSVGCQRDFCPSAKLEHVRLNTDGTIYECLCVCSGFGNILTQRWMEFTQNPWTVEQLPWAKNQWATFCPNPE